MDSCAAGEAIYSWHSWLCWLYGILGKAGRSGHSETWPITFATGTWEQWAMGNLNQASVFNCIGSETFCQYSNQYIYIYQYSDSCLSHQFVPLRILRIYFFECAAVGIAIYGIISLWNSSGIQPLPALLDDHARRQWKDGQADLPPSDAVPEDGKPEHCTASWSSKQVAWYDMGLSLKMGDLWFQYQ